MFLPTTFWWKVVERKWGKVREKLGKWWYGSKCSTLAPPATEMFLSTTFWWKVVERKWGKVREKLGKLRYGPKCSTFCFSLVQREFPRDFDLIRLGPEAYAFLSFSLQAMHGLFAFGNSFVGSKNAENKAGGFVDTRSRDPAYVLIFALLPRLISWSWFLSCLMQTVPGKLDGGTCRAQVF